MQPQLPQKIKTLGLVTPESSVTNVIEIPGTIIFRFSKTSNATTVKVMTCADVKSQGTELNKMLKITISENIANLL